jgi:hypothetical protein
VGEYVSNVESFLAHDEVTWRESMDGTSFLMAFAGGVVVVGAAVWWWRRRGS